MRTLPSNMTQPTSQSTSPHDTYTSPLAARNASPEMCKIWSPRHKFTTWRKIWLAVAQAQQACGLDITDQQINEMKAALDVTDEDMDNAAKYERELRHDVMAHVHAFGDRCPSAKGIIHLGCTSQDVVCNADLINIQAARELIRKKVLRVIFSLTTQAIEHKKLPTLGFTHYQPAQPVTVGRRITGWVYDLELIQGKLYSGDGPLLTRLRGFKGATGTQASFLQLFNNDSKMVDAFEEKAWENISYQLAEPIRKRFENKSKEPETLREQLEGFFGEEWYLVLEDEPSEEELNGPPKKHKSLGEVMEELDPEGWKEFVQSDQLNTVLYRYHSTVGQTYPRVEDTFTLAELASAASVLHKIATDIRLLSNRKEIDEPFGKNQIGSSAMPYKRNPMKCERICGLTRFVMNLVGNAYDTAATQWLERTLDDSSNRRLSLPEAFLALDGALDLMHTVASGLVVNEAMVRKNLMLELPFMATENILMEAVKAGGDRQDLHEKIRVHSQEAGHRVKQEGLDNDLIDRLKADPDFAPIHHMLTEDQILNPMNFIGRSVEQTERFISEVVEPLKERYKDELESLGSADRGV